MYSFTNGDSYEQARREANPLEEDIEMSKETIADYYNYCREVIVADFMIREQERGKIGGPGKIVQIDESKIGKRKYNRGRMVEGHWIIGIYLIINSL